MYGDAPSVAQGDPQGMFVLDDMVGGDDVPFLGDDDSGTQAVAPASLFSMTDWPSSEGWVTLVTPVVSMLTSTRSTSCATFEYSSLS